MGRSEAISSHLKPSIIGVTIYRATYRAFVRLGDDDRINFRRVPFARYPARARACLHPCKCWPQQRLKDCTEVFVARDLRSFNIAYAIHTPESPLLIDADGRNKHVVQWCGTVCSCFSSIRINFRRNNERGQKLSGRSFIEQDATGRVHSSATNTSASPIKITIRKTANYIFFSLFFL